MAEHGTVNRYKRGGCGCADCRRANIDYERNRLRQIAYGRWRRLVDAEPARAHVRALQEAGIGIDRISELSGVSTATISALLYGKPSAGAAPTKRMRPGNAEALLSIRARLEDYDPKAVVDATGTRRRLQALCANGWNLAALAERLGMLRGVVRRWVDCDGVWARHAIAVRDLYDELWNVSPESAGVPVGVALRSRNLAASKHWAPPMAWDDDTIDDPTAKPQGAGYEPARGKLPEPGEIAHLIAGGDSVEVLADRYDVSVRYVRDRIDQQPEVARG